MPPEIRAALLLWLTALVVLEAGLGLVAGRDGIRLVLIAVALVLITRMAAGRNWARHTLTVVFGLGATPWLAAGAAWWISGDAAASPTVGWLIGTGPGGLTSWVVAASVLAHVAAVTAGLVYMYRPAANAYFRAARTAARRTAGKPQNRANDYAAPLRSFRPHHVFPVPATPGHRSGPDLAHCTMAPGPSS
jgi:hypothetical protein